MSEPYTGPNKQEARAQVQAEKAHRKAMRPWYAKKRFILPLLLIAVIVFGRLAGGGDDPTTTAAPASDSTSAEAKAPAKEKAKKEPEPAEPAAAKIGEKVTAGAFEFKVTKLKCGVREVGSEYVGEKAQGQFCLLNLSVTNNGDEPEVLFGDNQKLLDKEGRTFAPDDMATIYADEDNSLFEEINPGNTLKGVIVFDIPKKAKAVEAQLAGGPFGIKDVAVIDLT